MDNDLSVLLKVILDSSGIGYGDISKIQKILAKYTVNVAAELDKTQLMNSVKQVLPQVIKEINKISGKDIKIDIDDSLIEKSINQVIQDGQRLEKELTATTQRINKIQLSMDNGHGVSQYQNRIQSLINDFQKYGVAAETAKSQTSSLQQILNNMKGLSGQELVAQADKFEQEFKAVKISIDEAKLSYDKLLQPITSSKQVNLTNKIEKWLANNTRATKSARQELELYLKEMSSGSINQEQYIKFSNRLTEIDTEMRSMGKLGKSLFQSLSEGAKKFTSWISATAIVMRVITTIRQAISTVRDLDNHLNKMKVWSGLQI